MPVAIMVTHYHFYGLDRRYTQVNLHFSERDIDDEELDRFKYFDMLTVKSKNEIKIDA